MVLMAGVGLPSCHANPRDTVLSGPQEAIAPEPAKITPQVAVKTDSAPPPAEADERSTPIEPTVVVEPQEEPEPEPELFAGRTRIHVDELFVELERVAADMETEPAVRADYEALILAHGLTDTDALYRDYVRVKLAFEATRDGGWWHLRWDITNKKPNSDEIWKQWARATVGDDEAPTPTAIAECDELSALFAFVGRKLGVRHLGLFWPQWNHVVAVWTVQSDDDTPVRIVVPTSQIFLDADDSLGTDGFDPWTQKKIFEYRRRDVKGSHRIDAQLARFFVLQARRHGGRSQVEQQQLRNARDLAMSAGES